MCGCLTRCCPISIKIDRNESESDPSPYLTDDRSIFDLDLCFLVVSDFKDIIINEFPRGVRMSCENQMSKSLFCFILSLSGMVDSGFDTHEATRDLHRSMSRPEVDGSPRGVRQMNHRYW